MLNVTHKPFYAESRYAECHYAECRSTQEVALKIGNIMRFTRVGSDRTCKYQTTLKMLSKYERSSLFVRSVTDNVRKA